MIRETATRRAARLALADAIAAEGMANAADSLRAGTWGNVWTVAAINALELTARLPLETGTDDV